MGDLNTNRATHFLKKFGKAGIKITRIRIICCCNGILHLLWPVLKNKNVKSKKPVGVLFPTGFFSILYIKNSNRIYIS